jgi:hypothetical protein
MRLKPKDISMRDKTFSKDLEIKRKTEEDQMFELIMDSVCFDKGVNINKELTRKIDGSEFKEECNLFKRSMEGLEVKPLIERRK